MVSAAAVSCWLMLALIHCFKRKEGIVCFVLMGSGPLAGRRALVHFGKSVKKMVDLNVSMIFRNTFLGYRFVSHSCVGYLFKDNVLFSFILTST